METLIFDIEADGLSELTLDRKGRPLPPCSRVHLLVIRSYPDGETTVYRNNDEEDTIADGWERLQSADLVIGHNIIQYDLTVLKRLYGGEVTGTVYDTLVAARLLWPDRKNHPHGGNSLDALSKAAGRVAKGEYTGTWDEWTQEMEDYCVRDVAASEAVYEFIQPKAAQFLPALKLEHRVARIIAQQQDNGVDIDVEACGRLIEELTLEQADCYDKLQAAFPPRVETMRSRWWQGPDGELYETKKEVGKGLAPFLVKGPHRTKEHPFNPGSSNQIADRLYQKYGWVAPRTDAGNASVTEDVLMGLDFPEAALLLRYQLAGKRLQHLQDWYTRATHGRIPGRIHPYINTNGAATGRMTHSQPNQTACPKVHRDKATGQPKLGYAGRYGWECRSLWRPRTGWAHVGGDASGLELRMLGHAVAPWDDGEYALQVVDGDVHTVNMEAGGLVTREQSKETFYAWIYGAGDDKLGETIADHQSLTKEQRAKYGSRRRANIGASFKKRVKRNIPALGKLIEWCQEQASEAGYIPLPDGRHAPVRSQHAALNVLLQGSGAVVMKLALVLHEHALCERGWRWGHDFGYMLNAHDEFQLETRPEIAEEAGKLIPWAIKEAGKRLNIRCPLDGDYAVGEHWGHTH